MIERDLILDGSHAPTYDEILGYIDGYGKGLWQDINSFIRERYKVSHNISYSKCSAKPGWNVKYQKSGKSICTLYPEKEGFVVLVVVLMDIIPLLEALAGEFETEVMEVIKSAKPFNGTKWLMISVNSDKVLNNIKHILLLKSDKKKG